MEASIEGMEDFLGRRNYFSADIMGSEDVPRMVLFDMSCHSSFDFVEDGTVSIGLETLCSSRSLNLLHI